MCPLLVPTSARRWQLSKPVPARTEWAAQSFRSKSALLRLAAAARASALGSEMHTCEAEEAIFSEKRGSEASQDSFGHNS